MSDDLIFDTPEPEPLVAVEAAPLPEADVVEPDPEPVIAEVDEDENIHKAKPGSAKWRDRANHYKEELDLLRQQLANKHIVAPQVLGDSRPNLENFETHDDWVEAVAEWKADKKIAELKRNDFQEKASKAWEEKAKTARAELPDFDEMLENAPTPSRAVADALMDSPLGAKIAYHLATHPEDYSRINKMSGSAAIREIVLIETKIATPRKEPIKTTQAPKPPTPVSSVSITPAKSKDGMEVY